MAFFDANDPSWFGEPYPIQRRNQYRGPHYFDMDFNLFKNFKVGERFNFAIGAQAFNVFNHPNFGLPNASYGSTFTGAAPIPIRTTAYRQHAGNADQPIWQLPGL